MHGENAAADDSEIVETAVEMLEVPIQEEEPPPFRLAFAEPPPPPPAPPTPQKTPLSEEAPPESTAPEAPSASSARVTRRFGSTDAARRSTTQTCVRTGHTEAKKKPRPGTQFIPSLQLPAWGTVRRARGVFSFSPFPFLMIAVLSTLPNFLTAFGIIPVGSPLVFILVWVGREGIANILQGVTAYAVFQVLRKNTVEIGDAFAKGLSHFLSVAVTAIFSILVIYSGIVAAVAVIVADIVGCYFIAAGLVVLSVFFYCAFIVAVPVCVVERLGPLASLRRSMALTKSFRGAIFWVMMLWFLFVSLLYFILSWVSGFVMIIVHPLVGWLMIQALGMYVLAVQHILFAVIYHDLRGIKDGVSVDSLVKVFD